MVYTMEVTTELLEDTTLLAFQLLFITIIITMAPPITAGITIVIIDVTGNIKGLEVHLIKDTGMENQVKYIHILSKINHFKL